tara:strand:- start:5222 stop:6214 length:993 start_codon:yes stop_codon:yes gene_type:complete
VAKSGTFQSKQNVAVKIITEAQMGTTPTDSAFITMPVTDFSFDEIEKHTLSQAPPRTGVGGMTMSDDMVKWQRHDRTFELSLSFHATAQAINRICLALYGDGDGTNALTGAMPTVTAYGHGTSNAVPVTVLFENASHDGDTVDMYFKSCLCTGLTLSGDIASNGGVVMATATFVTMYKPTEAALNLSGTETTLTAQTTMFNMHDLTATTLDSEDLLLYSFEVSLQRAVNKIGFDASDDFRGQGYAVGPYEVTGSLTCKRDGEVDDAINNSAGMILDLDTGVFKIHGEKVFVDTASISFDDDGWKQTVPLVFTYDSGATSNAVITIHTVAD